jgi:DNA-binding PadR family transcriptional regulator
MNAWEEKMVVPGRRQGNKGPTQQIATISDEGEENRERHQRVELKTASTSGKQRNTLENPQEDPI